MAHAVIRLDVGVVRHFWEGGENAVWRASAKLPAELVRKIKADYPLLMVNRPSSRRYDLYEAVFDYRDEQDKFGRPAPAFVAALYLHGDDATRETAVRDFAFPLAAASALDLSFEHALPAGGEAPRRPAPQTQQVTPAQTAPKRQGFPMRTSVVALSVIALGVAGVFAFLQIRGATEAEQGVDSTPQIVVDSGSSLSPIAGAAGNLGEACRQVAELADSGPANCATQFAHRYCAAPNASAAGWREARAIGLGYCGAYARLGDTSDFQHALANDLEAASENLSRIDRQTLRQDLLQIPDTPGSGGPLPLTQGGDERPTPAAQNQTPESRTPLERILEHANLGRRAEEAQQLAQLLQTWNAAVGNDDLGRHRIEANANAPAQVRAYISDYCATTRALANLTREYDKIGFSDPLLTSVQAGIDQARGGAPRVENCNGAIEPTLAEISRVTGVRNHGAAVVALVSVVDFCSLAPWSTLSERGVSELVRSCEDAALTLGVTWPEERRGRR